MMKLQNVYEEDVLPKPFRTTRGGKEVCVLLMYDRRIWGGANV